MLDIALLALRVVFGLLIVGHGAQKLFGWFGGPGLKNTTGWLASLNLKPAGMWALAAGGSEFVGGLLLVFGLLNPLGSFAIVAAMLMAILLVHRGKGLWITQDGSEYLLTIITVALFFALTGPGSYSLDAILGIALPAGVIIAAAALVVIGIVVALASRRQVEAQQAGA